MEVLLRVCCMSYMAKIIMCNLDMELKLHLPVKGYITQLVTQTVNSATRKPRAPA
jgi:hypothetical protein